MMMMMPSYWSLQLSKFCFAVSQASSSVPCWFNFIINVVIVIVITIVITIVIIIIINSIGIINVKKRKIPQFRSKAGGFIIVFIVIFTIVLIIVFLIAFIIIP